MNDTATLIFLANYSVWATRKLNAALANVSDDDFFKDNGLFFKSIFGTLNHILLGEHYLWFARFTHHTPQSLSLNTIIEPNRFDLLHQLEQKSLQWQPFLNDLNGSMPKTLTYTSSSGQQLTLPYGKTLLHVFNHATHHRGQISAALTAMNYDCPELDMVFMLVEEATET